MELNRAPHSQALATRAEAMALLCRALPAELSVPLGQHWPDVVFRELRRPETGLLMLRGRIGGDGAAFNLGEATMTRAVIELATGERGYGQILGRNPDHAREAALFDALRQRDAGRVDALVLAPIRQRLEARGREEASQIAATRVDFFTLVRGED